MMLCAVSDLIEKIQADPEEFHMLRYGDLLSSSIFLLHWIIDFETTNISYHKLFSSNSLARLSSADMSVEYILIQLS